MPDKTELKQSNKSQTKVEAKKASKKRTENISQEITKTKEAHSVLKREIDFPIVGIGASAGGLDAVEKIFLNMPSDSGMAYVVIQHLDPKRKSLMVNLLSKKTKMVVKDAEDGAVVRPDHVYIKPPGKNVTIRNRTLSVEDGDNNRFPHLPIDLFFSSLAEDLKEKAVCIILSGASNDGTIGAKHIKGEGGMVIAQDEDDAQYPKMPRSVIDTGIADFILPAEKIAGKLVQYKKHHSMISDYSENSGNEYDREIEGILMIVRTQLGHDFSNYKRNTVRRRIERRMALNQISDLKDYRKYLRQYPDEVVTLFRDFSINVTRFFRDAQAFTQIHHLFIKPVLNEANSGASFRIWIPGCATGEEVYSMAILLVETMEELDKYFQVKIFGTDINDQSINTARMGLFPENIVADLSEERLKRFFIKKGEKFHVDSKIRDLTVFAVHDIIRDPPFSDMDMISCRNMMIYMDGQLQKRIIPVLHYALRPGGILFLGTSESIGERGFFETLDKKHRIYRKKKTDSGNRYHFHYKSNNSDEEGMVLARENKKEKDYKVRKELRNLVEEAILKRYSPPAILLDDDGHILYFHGETNRYLTPPVGEPNFNIFNMISKEIHHRLSLNLAQIKKDRKPLTMKNIKIRFNNEILPLDISLTPIIKNWKERKWVLLEFHELRAETDPAEDNSVQEKKPPAFSAMKAKLLATQQELEATIEELETSNEELKSSNEELQANIEELQSTNEELESSQEELQSTNEELETVNSELQRKNQEMVKAEDDIKNLLASTDICTIFLDNYLQIQRFTPSVKVIFNIEEKRDIGRKISDLTTNLLYDNLEKDAEEVLDTLERKEKKVETKNGNIFLMRIVPYRTSSNIIEGVVLTFIDSSFLNS